jgi:alpha-tubulin suppressor-like RCC1 family protein
VVAPVGSGQTSTLDLSSALPAGVTAAVFNLTAVDPTDDTFVTAWPAGQSLPTASNLNVAPGTISPNLVTVGVSADRKVSLYNKNGQTDLVADLAGYYSPTSTQAFYPLSPLRVLDTRDGNGNPLTPIGANASREVGLSGWLPANASSAVVNLTGTNVTDGTFVTAWPAGQDRPTASNLNLVPGQTSANLSVVSLGTGGAIDLYNLNGQVDVIVDLFGYFAPQLTPCTAKCVVGFGTNSAGRLGNGTTSDASQTPTTVFGLTGVIATAGSQEDGYALRSDGAVWSWGSNGGGQLGNGSSGVATEPAPFGNNGRPFDSPVPVQVQGLSSIVAIAPGLALKSDGTVWSWGTNDMFQLGDGNTDDTAIASTPVQVSGLTNAVAIAGGGDNFYALTSDGKVWDWGGNIQGDLGTGTSGNINQCSAGEGVSPNGPNCASAVPVQVSGLIGVTKIGAGDAVTSDGHVWQWGPDGDSQNNSPVLVQGLSNVTAVATTVPSESTQYALESNGTVWSWGFNSFYGSYGNGTTCSSGSCNSDNPVQVSGITNATAISAGVESGYALKSDGTVWAWGGGQAGELGNGNPFASADVPLQVAGLSGVTAIGDFGYALVP